MPLYSLLAGAPWTHGLYKSEPTALTLSVPSLKLLCSLAKTTCSLSTYPSPQDVTETSQLLSY